MGNLAMMVPHLGQLNRWHAHVNGSERILTLLIAIIAACIVSLILQAETATPAKRH